MNSSNKKAYVVDIRNKEFSNNLRNELQLFYSNYYNDDLTVPLLVVIKENGSVSTHVGTLKDHDAHLEKLNNNQKKELKKILLKMIRE